MKYTLLVLILFIGNCDRYKFQDCNSVEHSNYTFKILKEKKLNDSLFLAHVYLSFPDSVIVSYDMMACSILEICRKESIIEGYFYRDVNCLYANEMNSDNKSKYDVKSFYDCYIGEIKIKWTKNWRQTISPYDIKFLMPPVKVKF